MFRFFLRRAAGLLLSLWVAVTLAFAAFYVIPGDPAEAALSQSTATEEVIELRREALGLDLPLHVQYTRYITGILHGDLGLSWSADQAVQLLIVRQLGPTTCLALSGMGVAALFGVALGVGAALGRGGLVGELSRSVTGFLLALPAMFSGTLVIWVFAIHLEWLPATGQGTFAQLILPAVVVGLSASGGISRTVESGVSEAVQQQFMQTAVAKGHTWLQAVVRHALRVGLLPTLDIVALQFGYLLGGAVVTESVFARQGIGRLLLTAVLNRDLPVVLGIVILSAAAYSILNLIADVAHAWFDPRIRYYLS